MVSGPSQCSLLITAYSLADPAFHGAFYAKGFARFVASAHASTATGWSESCRMDFLTDSSTGVLRLSHGAREGSLTFFTILQTSPGHKASANEGSLSLLFFHTHRGANGK